MNNAVTVLFGAKCKLELLCIIALVLFFFFNIPGFLQSTQIYCFICLFLSLIKTSFFFVLSLNQPALHAFQFFQYSILHQGSVITSLEIIVEKK